jgi:CHASE2 domain-containing sensor protein
MNSRLYPRLLWRRMPRSAKVFVSLFVLLTLQRALEITPMGDSLDSWGYDGLQWLRGPVVPSVVIVDISGLRQKDDITPRSSLQELVAALDDACAKAVAIDIDFSPDHNVFVGQDDPHVFESWNKLSMPVILGVERAAGGPRQAWLGRREFARLAAGIAVPYETGTLAEHGMLPGPYPVYIPRLEPRAPNEPVGDDDNLLTLAVALASTAKKDVAQTLMRQESLLDVFTRSIAERPLGDATGPTIPQFAVDYSSIDRLEARTMFAIWDKDGHLTSANHWDSVNGHLVLVGDVKGAPAADTFRTPSGKQASGVLHHAMATTTLLGKPLRVFRPAMREAANVACIALVATIILALKRWRKDLWHLSPRVQKYLVWPAIKCVLILASTLALAATALYVFNVLWIDCLVLALGGMVDAFVEEPTTAAIELGV